MKKSYFAGVALIVVLAFAGSASAYYTPINPSPSEPDLLGAGGILDTLYGLSNLERIEDGPLPGDQIWQNFGAVATATAKWSAVSQTFGYIPGDTGGVFIPLFTVYPDGYYPGVSGIIPGAVTVFRPADVPGGPTGPVRSSLETDNTSGNDHMVTWLITGGPSAGNYAIAFEDQDLGDADYNDLVVEIEMAAPGPGPPIPEASTLMLFGSGLSGLLFYARKRRLMKF